MPARGASFEAEASARAPLTSVRSGQLIAGARAALAFFDLLGFRVSRADFDVGSAKGVLWGYLIYSIFTFLAWRRSISPMRTRALPYVFMGIDVVVFTALIYLTSGADSPYFTPLIFLILSASIQWGSRGTLVMAMLAILIYVPAIAASVSGYDPDPGAAQIAEVRIGYIVAVTALLWAFARHVEQIIAELARLSDPVRDDLGEGGPPVREVLRHALKVFNAKRGAFLWSEGDEPDARLEVCEDGIFTTRLLSPIVGDFVRPDLSSIVFMADRAIKSSRILSTDSGARPPGAPIAPELFSQLDFDKALVIPVTAQEMSGWLLVLDYDEPAGEGLTIASVVGMQVSVTLERWQAQAAHRRAAAAETRVRLARDLHDGILQFLAGARLQLEALARSDGVSLAVADQLTTLRQALADEQRELRGFVSAVRPSEASEDGGRAQLLAGEVGDLAERLSRHWAVAVTSSVLPASLCFGGAAVFEIGRIVREGVANAVRHGGARNVSITVTADEDELVVRISDDGRGFPLAAYDEGDTRTTAAEVAPRSLRERARALGGEVDVESGAAGALVRVRIPIRSLR